ncbi:MAG: chromate efflux transporter, partial [Gemmatimonadaceae bacterium]
MTSQSIASLDATRPVSRAELALYFLRLGATGFGGPVALVGYMQRDLVERRGWFSETEFADGLALAQLSPGPMAAQLAMYLGWLRGGTIGASVIGVAFIGPPFLMVLLLAALYVRSGDLPWLTNAFLGVGAGVVSILARSTWKLARLTLRTDRVLWLLATANAGVVVATRREWLTLLLVSGVLRIVRRTAADGRSFAITPVVMLKSLVVLAGAGLTVQLFAFFVQAGAAVFGSGLAILPYLYAGVVEQRHWLSERQFLDAIAVSMITPGPVVITAGFIGFLVHGAAGAIAASLGVFAPCWVLV